MPARHPLILWLSCCCALIFTTALIGAITRLTESGLSITEWRPVSGALPPLDAGQWQQAFDLYRASPEFAAKHSWMDLGDFKRIFFWEWLHRLVDRLIGLVYAAGLAWFALRRRIPAGYGWRLAGILLLGGCEAPLGWWMVKSGLVHRPSVSPFLLAAHLCLALSVYSAIWWTILDLRGNGAGVCRVGGTFCEKRHGVTALLLLVTTIVWGAFTAGMKAGLLYNTFPLMAGHVTPPEQLFGPFDLLREPSWVQFTHRWLAVTTGLTILTFGWRRCDVALMAMVCVQIGLGISTLLSALWLPLAVAHQAGAIVLLTLTLRTLHGTRAA